MSSLSDKILSIDFMALPQWQVDMTNGPEMQGILENIGLLAMFMTASPTMIEREGMWR